MYGVEQDERVEKLNERITEVEGRNSRLWYELEDAKRLARALVRAGLVVRNLTLREQAILKKLAGGL